LRAYAEEAADPVEENGVTVSLAPRADGVVKS
jgi:hypothetical protein